MRYRSLGNSGLIVSVTGLGCNNFGRRLDLDATREVVNAALEAGVTLLDTADMYGNGGGSEEVLGEVLAGRRDEVVLATKFGHQDYDMGYPASLGPKGGRDYVRYAIDQSLRRLRTDHVDIYLNHAVNDVARMKNPEWHAFVEDAKHQGKIRFSGMSGHAGRLIECLDYSLDHDLVDVILVAYNFGQDPAFYQRLMRDFDTVAVQPDLPRVIRKAAEKRVGVLTMKTLMGARLNDMRPYENGSGTFAQAAFRWVLSNPAVTGVVISMTSRERIDEYLGASGALALRAGDLPMLARYLGVQGDAYCRHACGACEDACPSGVPIGEVLRTRMYARDYADLGFARREYAQLGAGAAACLTCTARACAGACPHGLTPATLAEESHRLLA